jgi:hypothetical protein
MLRSILIAPVLLVLAACASAPLVLDAVATNDKVELTDEIECMTECLDDGTEDCETCADRCLFRGADSLASNF